METLASRDKKADIAVIGAGGVVGSAILRHLAKAVPDQSIVGIERSKTVASETSGRNSGVLHSGFHERPGSLKAQLAQKGSAMAVEYSKRNELPIMECGMLIAIPRGISVADLARQIPDFFHLVSRGRAQNIDFQFLLGKAASDLEPNLNVVGGVFIPGVCVVDSKSFVDCLFFEAQELGAEYLFGEEVLSIERTGSQYIISTNSYSIRANTVINSAGLYADKIAAMAGFQYDVHFWRGEYYEVVGKEDLVSRLVYPVVGSYLAGKGIHFTPRLDGKLFLGPNARKVPAPDYYEEDKTPPDEFYQVARAFCNDIQPEDLEWAMSGIRPKLSATGREEDFLIAVSNRKPVFVNLIGIESPGLSASMAIASRVARIVG